MSPRAAWRLETLGFVDVADFVPGKQAWYEDNQRREGTAAQETWAGDVVDADVPTCGLDERIGTVRKRVRAGTCVVINVERIVLGLLRSKALDGDPDATAEEVMHPGPSTFRPNLPLAELTTFMRDHDIKTNALITTGAGRLIGVISRADVEATAAHETAV